MEDLGTKDPYPSVPTFQCFLIQNTLSSLIDRVRIDRSGTIPAGLNRNVRNGTNRHDYAFA